MKFKIKLNKDDMLKLNQYYIANDEKIKKKINIQRFSPMIIVISLAIYAISSKSTTPIWNYAVIIGFVMLWAVFYGKIFKWQVKKQVEKSMAKPESQIIFQERIMEFNEDNFTEEVQGDKKTYGYEEIAKAKTSEDAVYLFMDRSSAYVIPKRAFQNKIEMKSFTEDINQKIEQAKTKSI